MRSTQLWLRPAAVLCFAALSLSLVACADSKQASDAPTADAGSDAGGDALGSGLLVQCPTAAWQPGLTTVKLKDAGLDRSYIVYVPKGLDSSKPSPLVLNYHGLTSNAAQQVAFSGLNATADKNGFIVVYPEGINKSFNAGDCCGSFVSPPNTADDGAFTRHVIEDVAAQICVDKRRVYSTGMSNGGYMSEYNACVNADVFAAVAPVAGMGMKQPSCEPARPIPMIAFNGTADALVNYDAATTSVNDWLKRDGCTGKPTRKDFGKSYCETWSSCKDGVAITHCTLTGEGHCWPGTSVCPFGASNTEINADDEMWKFLKRYTLPK